MPTRTALSIAIVLAASVTLAGCSSAPLTFTAKGTMTVPIDESISDLSDGSSVSDGTCSIGSGYSDISKGAQVIVKNASDKTVAIGKLTSERVNDNGDCSFGFSVPNVPTGLKIYGIEVTHRGVVSETEKAMRSGKVALALS
jgi:hypothetical protein